MFNEDDSRPTIVLVTKGAVSQDQRCGPCPPDFLKNVPPKPGPLRQPEPTINPERRIICGPDSTICAPPCGPWAPTPLNPSRPKNQY